MAKKASKKPASKKSAKAASKKPANKPSRSPAVRSTSRKVQKTARTTAPKSSPPTRGKRPSATTGSSSTFSRPIPTPVTTDGKPKKNQAGFTSKELEHYRELLLAKRREIVGDMSQMEREALRSAGGNLSNLPLHMADMGTDNYEQEFTLGLVEKDRVLLREINQGLAKLQDGTFGICEGTGKPIGKPRLEAQPWARFSIEYARQQEQGFHRNH